MGSQIGKYRLIQGRGSVKRMVLSPADYGAGLVLLSCVLALLSCAAKNNTVIRYNAPDADTVSIGVVYPQSQWDNDKYLREAIELAVTHVNETGGVLGKPLSLMFRDDFGDSNTAQEIAETFSASGITAVVGHWGSSVCYYVEDIYEEREIVMLTPAATSMAIFEQDYWYIYRMIANNQKYAEALAEYAEAEGIRCVAIFLSEDPYGTDLAHMVERELATRGIPVVDRVTSITATNAGDLLRRWRAFGCDGVVIAANWYSSTEPIKIIRDAGARMPIFSEVFKNTTFSELRAGYTDNYYGVVYSRVDMDPVFLADFYAAYGRIPDAYEVSYYEAVRLLANAMNAEGSISSASIAHYLQNLQDYPAVMGRISYDPSSHEFEGLRMRVRLYTDYEANEENEVE